MIWLTLLACSSGPCDDGQLKDLSSAIGSMEKRYHQQLAAQGLKEACELPPAVEKGLDGIAGGWPGTTGLLDMAVAADAPEVWAAACPGGPSVLAEAMQLAEPDKRKAVWKGCDLGRHGWSEGDYAKATGAVVSPVVLLHLLKDESGFHKGIALQALAGI